MNMQVRADLLDGVAVVRPRGLLNSSTYLRLRDGLIKAGASEPDAVLAHVDALIVPAPSAWAVLTNARWELGRWPGIALCVAATNPETRARLRSNGITRYVPVYKSRADALAAIRRGEHRCCRMRATATLSRDYVDAGRSRRLVAEWAHPEYGDVAQIVVTTFVENVLQHTDSVPALRLEMHRDSVTVAVGDTRSESAVRHEATSGTSRLSRWAWCRRCRGSGAPRRRRTAKWCGQQSGARRCLEPAAEDDRRRRRDEPQSPATNSR